MDVEKILEMQKMSKQYTREEMLRLNEEEEPIFKPVGGIVEDDEEEFDKHYSGKLNVTKALALQRISKAYTREKMFKMNEERADIMRKRDEYLNREDNSCGYIIAFQKVKVKK